MKTRYFKAALLCCLATLPLGAQSVLESALAGAMRDPKNAPAMLALTAKENPDLTGPIVTGATKALPTQALEIVRVFFNAAPKQQPVILRAAILGQPTQAVEITTIALGMFPNQAGQILKTALEVAPENLRSAIEALGQKIVLFDQSTGTGRPARVSFPRQPIRPDLVSPSQ